MEFQLRHRCIMCGSYKWCGRPCQNAPASVASATTQVENRPTASQAQVFVEPRPDDIKPPPKRARPHPKGEQTAHHKPGRPKSGKTPVFLRLDQDLVEHFRQLGPGWQRHLNDALRRAVLKV